MCEPCDVAKVQLVCSVLSNLGAKGSVVRHLRAGKGPNFKSHHYVMFKAHQTLRYLLHLVFRGSLFVYHASWMEYFA